MLENDKKDNQQPERVFKKTIDLEDPHGVSFIQ
jgi:hypothetical protein